MPTYRHWVFEVAAPHDDFLRRMKRSLVEQGLHLERAQTFDFAVRGWGARGYVKVEHHPDGLAATVKLKAALFGSVPALEDAILHAGQRAQAGLLFGDRAAAGGRA